MNTYEKLSKERIECPYCNKIVSLFNMIRHRKGKKCNKLKDKYLNVHKDETEDHFDLYVNELRQNILNNEMYG
jgi:hypothetical protein